MPGENPPHDHPEAREDAAPTAEPHTTREKIEHAPEPVVVGHDHAAEAGRTEALGRLHGNGHTEQETVHPEGEARVIASETAHTAMTGTAEAHHHDAGHGHAEPGFLATAGKTLAAPFSLAYKALGETYTVTSWASGGLGGAALVGSGVAYTMGSAAAGAALLGGGLIFGSIFGILTIPFWMPSVIKAVSEGKLPKMTGGGGKAKAANHGHGGGDPGAGGHH